MTDSKGITIVDWKDQHNVRQVILTGAHSDRHGNYLGNLTHPGETVLAIVQTTGVVEVPVSPSPEDERKGYTATFWRKDSAPVAVAIIGTHKDEVVEKARAAADEATQMVYRLREEASALAMDIKKGQEALQAAQSDAEVSKRRYRDSEATIANLNRDYLGTRDSLRTLANDFAKVKAHFGEAKIAEVLGVK